MNTHHRNRQQVSDRSGSIVVAICLTLMTWPVLGEDGYEGFLELVAKRPEDDEQAAEVEEAFE